MQGFEPKELPHFGPTDLADAVEDRGSGFDVRVLHDDRPVESTEKLRARLVEAERVEADLAARQEASRAARALERADAAAARARRVSEIAAALDVIVKADDENVPSYAARVAARAFLQTGASAMACPDVRLRELSGLHIEIVRFLGEVGTDDPMADRLDALECAVWSALHTRAWFVADPSAA
jgi:hypothetical protein